MIINTKNGLYEVIDQINFDLYINNLRNDFTSDDLEVLSQKQIIKYIF